MYQMVCFDLETTGLHHPDIIQLAAVDFETGRTFQTHFMPRKTIEPEVLSNNGACMKKNVNSVDIKCIFNGNEHQLVLS